TKIRIAYKIWINSIIWATEGQDFTQNVLRVEEPEVFISLALSDLVGFYAIIILVVALLGYLTNKLYLKLN
uniref:hypothetical protein n=1 Tax=Candidatus Enterovibrio escicola TaxID=1927127 RepID=UPI001CC2A69A